MRLSSIIYAEMFLIQAWERKSLILRLSTWFLPLGILFLLNYVLEYYPAPHTFRPDEALHGSVLVEISAQRFLAGKLYRTYRLNLDSGSIDLLRVEQSNDPKAGYGFDVPPPARIGLCAYDSRLLYSPDRAHAAYCPDPNSHPKSVVIVQAESKSEVCRIPVRPSDSIRNFVWSPDSQSIAIMQEDLRIGFGPGDIAHWFFGVPSAYKSIGIVVSDPTCSHQVNVPKIGRQFSGGFGIIWWE